MATPSSVLAGKSHGEEPGGLQSTGSQESDTTKHTCTQAVVEGLLSSVRDL